MGVLIISCFSIAGRGRPAERQTVLHIHLQCKAWSNISIDLESCFCPAFTFLSRSGYRHVALQLLLSNYCCVSLTFVAVGFSCRKPNETFSILSPSQLHNLPHVGRCITDSTDSVLPNMQAESCSMLGQIQAVDLCDALVCCPSLSASETVYRRLELVTVSVHTSVWTNSV